MTYKRRWLFAGTLSVLVCALAAIAVTAQRLPTGTAPAAAPLAVVLVPRSGGSDLVVVDLDAARVVRRVRLRSLATDIELDAARGTVVGAQTGGLGDDADDALSITDPRSGDVRYVTLPRTDPSQVECVGGRAFVLHSWVVPKGFVMSVVDLAAASVVATGFAPDGTGLWNAAQDRIWTTEEAQGARRFSVVTLDTSRLRSARVAVDVDAPAGVLAVGSDTLLLGAAVSDPATAGRALLVDRRATAVVASATVEGLLHGAQYGAVVGDAIVVGDWIGEPPESDALAVLRRDSLAQIGMLHVGSAPCAIAAFGNRLLVVDRVEGVLRQLDPITGRVDWSVDLGSRDLLCSQVLVLERTSEATSTAGGAGAAADR